MRTAFALILAALALTAIAAPVPPASSFKSGLPGCRIDPSQVGVAGLSAGAFQAVQIAVAHSSIFSALGVVAGGPFYCAENEVALALSACMKTPSLISVDTLLAEMTYMATTLQIDSPSQIADTAVFIYSGTKDTVVHPGVVEKLEKQLTHWVTPTSMTTQYSIPSVHSFVTDYTGNACDNFASPYIVNCGYDLAGDMLTAMFGPLVNRTAPSNPPAQSILNNIYEFSQKKYIPGIYTLGELALYDYGYAYIPPACLAENSTDDSDADFCSLLILVHGCLQSIPDIGYEMVYNTGILQYAETNNIVVLFPQVVKNTLSPNACWDWWGYTGVEYPTKLGPQISTIMGMAEEVMRKR